VQGASRANGLALTPAQRTALGIELTPATASRHTEQVHGYGVVVGRDFIAQALAEVVSAAAAAQQSHAALARMQRLAGTAGADSAAARDTAQRQVTADDAALAVAQAKVSASLGRQSPWAGLRGQALMQALASSPFRMIRVSFPLGKFSSGVPTDLGLTRLDGTGAEGGAIPWRVTRIWSAPEDPALPGRSYFATVEHSDLNDGERLLASAAAGQTALQPGVFIPASAVIVDGDRYWCYVQRQPGVLRRVAIDISRPEPGGYFIAGGIAPNEAVVTAGAGLLLARELNPSANAEP
jgi:hypothetical protein